METASDIAPASEKKWYRYYWQLCGYFGIECYRTWRFELLASVGVGFFFAMLGGNWKDFRTMLMATGLTLGLIALAHLVRTPWMLYKAPEDAPGFIARAFGVLVIVGICVGGILFAKTMWNARPLGTITAPRFIIQAPQLRTPPPVPTGPSANLDAALPVFIRVVFPGDPFPVGKPVNLYVVLHNYGPGDAVDGRHISHIYICAMDDLVSQKKMIEQWKSFVAKMLGNSPGDPIFHANTDQTAIALSDESVDELLHKSIWSGQPDQPPHIFVVSLVRFRDGTGYHEAHFCREFMGMGPQGVNWKGCLTYMTPVNLRHP